MNAVVFEFCLLLFRRVGAHETSNYLDIIILAYEGSQWNRDAVSRDT